MMNAIDMYNGIPVFIATREYQRRKHHKKRINKKWRKRYGVVEYNSMPHGQVLFSETGRVLYMTKKTFEEVKKMAEKV